MSSVPEATRNHRVWGYVVFSSWLCSVVLAASIVLVGVSRAPVSDSGFEFLAPYIKASIPAVFAFFLAAVCTGFAPRRRQVTVLLLLFGTTFMAAWATNMIARSIEYDRTPPCWGIHSLDPGSGLGCPGGMREDFTRSQLDEWYRKQ